MLGDTTGDNFMWFPEGSGDRPMGETTDAWFAGKKAFEVWDLKFNMNNSESTDAPSGGGGKGGGAGKAKFGEFSISKTVDSASVPLYKACSLGNRFPTAMLAIRKAGGSNLLYIQFIFRDCQVTGITWNAGTAGKRPTEDITFAFKAMGFQYIPQNEDGRSGKPLAWSWNTAVNQGTLEMKGLPSAPNFLPGTQA
jgi:type VI protein secretion system component Hcp